MTDKCEFFTYKDFRDERYAWPPSPEACAEIANRILSKRGQRVYAHSTGSEWTTTHKPAPGEWFDQRRTALLIDIRPIERDTAENLLRELAETIGEPPRSVDWRKIDALIERARKLLAKQAGEK